MAQEVTRWGILGTGNIATKFATGLAYAPDAELVAVGSRARETAEAFGEKFNVPRRHASYEALAADPEVDAIYVSTLNPCHKANTILCLEAGKAVLCEKPFAINAAEAAEMVAVARREKRFLMEAMWTRFIPATVRVREWLAEGAIGAPRMFHGSFGFAADKQRLWDPEMGGGALLDVGIYPLSYASMVFGRQPVDVAALAEIGKTGVDEQGAVVLRYDDGELATLTFAFRTETFHEARIMGTKGRIDVAPPFWKATEATLYQGEWQEAETHRIELPYDGNGYEFEAAEVGRCLREGKLESDVMPLDETLAIMKTMDCIREQWDMKYPME